MLKGGAVRLAELQGSWEFGMHLWRYMLSLAQNFQENSVEWEEKQCNDMTPGRACLGLADRPEIAFQLYCSDPMFQ